MQELGASAADTSRLAATILEMVRAEFEPNGSRRVVLLSNLGQALLRRGVDYREILGDRKLGDYIRSDLGDRISIVEVPGKDKAFAAYPVGVSLEDEDDPFGIRGRGKPGQSGRDMKIENRTEKRPLIHRQVWFAFSHALGEGEQRLLSLKPEIAYHDVPADADADGRGYLVDRDLIVPSGELPRAERDSLIFAHLRNWLQRNGLSMDQVLEAKPVPDVRRSVLDELLAALSPNDLARIAMPLDVIRTLRDRRV